MTKSSVRLQSNSRFFKSYNFSFTEPWLGGKKPRSLTVGAVQTAFDYSLSGAGKLKITRGFVGIGSQLKWPDDFFSSNTTLNIEQINLDNFRSGGFAITKGTFNNFSVKQTFTRSSISDPLFPRRGSKVSLALQITPPYSLFRKDNTFTPSAEQRAEIVRELIFLNRPGKPVTEADIEAKKDELKQASKFKWLEHHNLYTQNDPPGVIVLFDFVVGIDPIKINRKVMGVAVDGLVIIAQRLLPIVALEGDGSQVIQCIHVTRIQPEGFGKIPGGLHRVLLLQRAVAFKKKLLKAHFLGGSAVEQK